jgi:acyl dehydratase
MIAGMTTIVQGIQGLRDIVGQHLGYSDYVEVTQEQVNQFAEATGDHQWIHVDVERAKKESPFGTTIAHGNLTLCLCDSFRDQLFKAESGFKMGINYGWNKVRYTSPVPAGSRIRASLETLDVEDKGGGWYQLVQKWTVEIEGQEKPALFAESVVRLLA